MARLRFGGAKQHQSEAVRRLEVTLAARIRSTIGKRREGVGVKGGSQYHK